MIFQGLSVPREWLRPDTAPLTILAIKKGLLCNFPKNFKGRYFMGHNGTDLKFLLLKNMLKIPILDLKK